MHNLSNYHAYQSGCSSVLAVNAGILANKENLYESSFVSNATVKKQAH